MRWYMGRVAGCRKRMISFEWEKWEYLNECNMMWSGASSSEWDRQQHKLMIDEEMKRKCAAVEGRTQQRDLLKTCMLKTSQFSLYQQQKVTCADGHGKKTLFWQWTSSLRLQATVTTGAAVGLENEFNIWISLLKSKNVQSHRAWIDFQNCRRHVRTHSCVFWKLCVCVEQTQGSGSIFPQKSLFSPLRWQWSFLKQMADPSSLLKSEVTTNT